VYVWVSLSLSVVYEHTLKEVGGEKEGGKEKRGIFIYPFRIEPHTSRETERSALVQGGVEEAAPAAPSQNNNNPSS
jgi:hypothetical protein